jgi:hypothetical protein
MSLPVADNHLVGGGRRAWGDFRAPPNTTLNWWGIFRLGRTPSAASPLSGRTYWYE